MFETRIRETRWLVFLKRAGVIVVGFYLIIGMIALYRAVTQIHSLAVQADGTLRSGSAITSTVVSTRSFGFWRSADTRQHLATRSLRGS